MSCIFRPRRLTRRLTRPLTYRCRRRLTRRIGRGPRVNYLGQALGAFTRAIRAHRRLIQLAPEIFDEAVVRRDAAERTEREAIHREASIALEKVYGPDPPERHRSPKNDRCRNGAETVQFSRRKRAKQAKVEALSAELDLWLAAGRAAFERHQHLRPHRLLSLGTVARMVDIATQFGRLACGLPWPGRCKGKPPEEFSLEAIPFAVALERVYGGDESSVGGIVSSGAGS